MEQSVRDYIAARCEARRAWDRYDRAAGDKAQNRACQLYAGADRTTWPDLDRAKAHLDADQSVTNPAAVIRALEPEQPEQPATLEAQWNTGRLYQVHGQRIVARLTGRTVLFNDISRMITGEFEINPAIPAPATHDALKACVMARYDANKYRPSCEAARLRWED